MKLCIDPGTTDIRTFDPAGAATAKAAYVMRCKPSAEKLWVKEPVYTIKSGKYKIVLAISQFNLQAGAPAKFKWGFKGIVPIGMDLASAIDLANFPQQSGVDNLSTQKLVATSDFLTGLIPVGGSIYMLHTARNSTDVAIGVAGLVGDVGLVSGLVADVCKLPNLVKLLRAGGCYADIASNSLQVVLVAKQFWNNDGTSISAAMGTVAFAQLMATAVLLKKHRAALNQEVATTPNPSFAKFNWDDIPPVKNSCPKTDQLRPLMPACNSLNPSQCPTCNGYTPQEVEALGWWSGDNTFIQQAIAANATGPQGMAQTEAFLEKQYLVEAGLYSWENIFDNVDAMRRLLRSHTVTEPTPAFRGGLMPENGPLKVGMCTSLEANKASMYAPEGTEISKVLIQPGVQLLDWRKVTCVKQGEGLCELTLAPGNNVTFDTATQTYIVSPGN